LATETGTSRLVPETMTHFASKRYMVKNKTKMNSDCKNFENDDVIAAVLAFMLLKKSKRKAT